MKAEHFIENNYHSKAGLEADKLIEDKTGKEVSFEEIAEAYYEHKLKLLGIANVVGSALVEIESPYIEDADDVLRGDIYTVDGRVSKCWILETDFDNIKCTHN